MQIESEFDNQSDVPCRYHSLQLQRGGLKPLPQFESRSGLTLASLCRRFPRLAFDHPPAPEVFPILRLSVDKPVDSLANIRIFKFINDFPIQLITLFDVKKSDSLFDSDI
jgi:hypothetical protein